MAATGEAQQQASIHMAATGSESVPAGVLARLWAARGFFGGLIAIGLGALGQSALLTQNDFRLAWLLYGAAIVLLILSLMHPALPRRTSRQAAPDSPTSSDAKRSDLPEEAPSESDTPPLPKSVSVTPYYGAVPVRASRRAAHAGERRAMAAGPSQLAPAVPWVPEPGAAPGEARASGSGRYFTAARRTFGRLSHLRGELGWRVTAPGLVLSLALAGASTFILFRDLTDPLGGWLWVASLVVLLLTFLGAPGWPRGAGLLPGPDSDFFAVGIPRIPVRIEAVLVGVMMLLALLMRVYNLETHPGIFGDEGEQGMDVRAIIEGRPAPIFGSGWWGVPNLSFYLWQFTLRMFGDDTMVGVRMFSVINGLVSVWFIYKIGRLLWGQRVGLIAGYMLAVSPLALQFSRFANVSSETAALWAVGAYFLFMALRHRRWSDWVLAGFFWSFNLYFYPAGKLVVPLIGVIGLYCLVRWRKEFFKQYLLGFALLGLSFTITFMPMAAYSSLDDWQSFSGRAGETSIFSPQNQAGIFESHNIPYNPEYARRSMVENLRSDPVTWAQVVYHQARVTFDALYRRGDATPYYRIEVHNGTVLSPFWAVLTLLGLAYALWKIWDARYGIALLWFAVGLSAAFLTTDTPSLQRFAGAWTVVMLFPAVLLDRVFAAAWPASKSLARRWATVPLALLLVYFGADSFQEYFGHYTTVCPFCDSTVQARYADSLGQDYRAYQMGVGGYDHYFTYGSTRFLAKGVEGVDMLAAAGSFPITDNNGKGAAFIIYPNNAEYLSILRQYYPEGIEKARSTDTGSQVFTSYEVTLEQLEARRASLARYELPNGHWLEVEEQGIGTGSDLWTPPGELTYPTRAEWRTGLVVPNYGVYTLAVEGAPGSRLEVDGKPLAQVPEGGERAEGEIVLAKGVHQVLLGGTLPSEGAQARLLWAGEGAPLEPVDRLFLWAGPDGGLLAEVGPPGVPPEQVLVAPDPFAGAAPPTRRVDPFVGYREGSTVFGNSVWLARWRGKLLVPAGEVYTFTMNSNPQGVIVIDGTTVLGQGPGGAGFGTAELSRGEHDIEIRYMSQGAPARVEVLWQSQTMPSQIIPPTALRPLKRSWRPDEAPDAPGGAVPAGAPGKSDFEPVAVYSEGDLTRPRGIAVDAQGHTYVGDRGNSRIVVYSPEGSVLSTWGTQAPAASEGQTLDQVPVEPGQFFEINDLAVGADGLVYVLDMSNRVQAFTPEGVHMGSYEPAQLGLYAPNGVAAGKVGGRDSILLAVTGQNRLISLPLLEPMQNGESPLPDAIVSIAPEGAGAFEQPVDVAVDPTGSGLVYAIDLRDRLMQLKLSDGGAWTVVRQWQVPVGRDDGGSRLAVSPDGSRVYMSDPDRKSVAVIDVNRTAATYFGSEGSEPGRFGGPGGIAAASDGKVYVLDVVNANVQVFAPGEK